MRTIAPVLWAIAISILSAAAIAQETQKPGPTGASATVSAWVSPVRVSPEEFAETARKAADDAAKEVLDSNADRADLRVTVIRNDATSYLFTIFAPHRQIDEAKKLIDKTVENLDKRVRDLIRPEPAALKAAEAQLEKATAELASSDTRLQRLTRDYEDVLRLLRLTPADLYVSLSRVNDEVQALELDLTGLEARTKAIEQKAAELTEKISKKVETDEIAHELQAAVDARSEQVKRLELLVESGRATPAEVGAAKASLAEGRARVLERQEVVMNRAGGDVLAGWNRELLNLSIDQAEKNAKVKVLSERRRLLAGADDKQRERENAFEMRKKAEEKLSKAKSALSPLQDRQNRASQPVVRITERKEGL